MDFNKILSLAAENRNIAEQKRPAMPALSTKFAAPKKEKKDQNAKSETLRKLLEEKEREKKEKEQAERRRQEEKVRKHKLKKEEELRRQKEEEKKNRFRIPKKVQNSDVDKTEDSSKLDSSLKTSSSISDRSHKKLESSLKTSSSISDRSLKKLESSVKTSSSISDRSHKKLESSVKTSSAKSDRSLKPSSEDLKSNNSDKISRVKVSDKSSNKSSKEHKSCSSDRSLSSSSKTKSYTMPGSDREKHPANLVTKKKKSRSASDISNKTENISLNHSKISLEEPVTYTHLKSDSGNTRIVNCTSKEEEIKRKLQEKLARIKGCLSDELNADSSSDKKKKNMDGFINDDEDDVHKNSKSRKKEKNINSENDQNSNHSKHSKGERKRSKHKGSDQIDQSDKSLHKHSKFKGSNETGNSFDISDRDKLQGSKVNEFDMKNKNFEFSKSKDSKPTAPKKLAPPPMGFSDLLKLATTKSVEPIKFEPVIKSKKEKEPSRLRTQEEIEREKERKNRLESKDYQDWYKFGSTKSNDTQGEQKIISKNSSSSSLQSNSETGRVKFESKKTLHSNFSKSDSKLNSASKILDLSSNHNKISTRKINIPESVKKTALSKVIPESDKKTALSKVQDNSKMNVSRESSNNHKKMQLSDKTKQNYVSKISSESSANKKRPHMPDKVKTTGRDSPDESGQKKRKLENHPDDKNKIKKKTEVKEGKYSSTNENVLVCGPPKEKLSKPSKVELSNPWDRIYGSIKQQHPKTVKKKPQDFLNDDTDSEYDEEMDDFIVDEEEEYKEDYRGGEDYSRYIREIFGYDKRKFKYESDREIANMTANFSQCMKEEARSARIGKQEDLEDIRKEEEELRRKALAKKKKK